MATVPELKAQAKVLNVKGYSKMLKPELIAAIAEAERDELKREAELMGLKVPHSATAADIEQIISNAQREADASQAKSVTRTVLMPTEIDRANKRRIASLVAGEKGKRTAPMINLRRVINYREQNGTDRLTSAQSRRERKKGNKLKGFNGCTLADFRTMRRALKKGTPVKAS